jgi:hypothetical protein
VEECRSQQPYEIVPRPTAPLPDTVAEESMDTGGMAADSGADTDQAGPSRLALSMQMSVDSAEIPSEPLPSTSNKRKHRRRLCFLDRRCHQQRAALIKSLLNFIKRAIQDSQFADSVRHSEFHFFCDATLKIVYFSVMDGPLPGVLKHMISNPDYYGPSLFQNGWYFVLHCCIVRVFRTVNRKFIQNTPIVVKIAENSESIVLNIITWYDLNLFKVNVPQRYWSLM